MAAELRTLDGRGRLTLPRHFTDGQAAVALICLPECVLGILTLSQFAAARVKATEAERRCLEGLTALEELREIVRGYPSRRVHLPQLLRQQCGFRPFAEVVVAGWRDGSLRVMTAERWGREVGDLLALAAEPGFPVARGRWEPVRER